MPKAKLSRSLIDKLEGVPGKQIVYFDTRITGFGVKVNGSSKTYIVQTRIKGQRNNAGRPLEIYVSIGRTDIVDFEKACAKARKIIEDAGEGISPEDIKRQRENTEADNIAKAAKAAKANITLQEVLEKYVATKKRLKQSTVDTYTIDIDRYISPWKCLPIRSIDGAMIVDKHAEIGKKSKAKADGVMRVVRALFNYASRMYDDVIHKNPVDKLSALNAWYKVPSRKTYIKPHDLKLWLPAVLKLSFDTSQDFLLLMLFHGSRKTETSTLKWKDINFTTGCIVFRETKTGIVLEVPMSRFIHDRLQQRMGYYYNGPDSYVFPSYGKSGHIEEARTALKKVAESTGVTVSHHDLRRSFISYCEELEITLFARKRLANHAIPLDVTEGYTMFNMDKLRRITEQIASFILDHAGIGYTSNPAEDIVKSEIWKGLSEDQRAAILHILDTKKEPQGQVIDLEAVRVRRRMGKVKQG